LPARQQRRISGTVAAERAPQVWGKPVLHTVKLAAAAMAVVFATAFARPAAAYPVQNLTGLPVFPSLSKAAMDTVSKTDTLGRWCSRFAAETSYPLDKVEAWYRKALVNASETNLADDDKYKPLPGLNGIKLALGIDYVTLFRVAGQAGTSIELFKCSPPELR
jgi:hypothetical protein